MISTNKNANECTFRFNHLFTLISPEGKQDFRRTAFGSRLLPAEGEGRGAVRVRVRVRGVSEVKQYPSGSG